jgi:hypothetical protein
MKHHLSIFLRQARLEASIEDRLFRDRVVPLPPGPIFNLSEITLPDLPMPNFTPWPGFLAGAPQPPAVVEPQAPPDPREVQRLRCLLMDEKPPIFPPPVPPTFIPKPL